MSVLPTEPPEIICPCSGTRTQRVIELLAKEAISLETICRRTGAMTGCGSCESDLQQLLQEYRRLD